jgi:alkanesulfonate monooxygenase SsuD/methylene tetrahydromethanopterin reductase-like flavin-dependent oxidoreductase (luciferase family)
LASIRQGPARRAHGANATAYHDPFVLFGFLVAASRKKLGFAAGVLILAQRQAALVAKQAACLDELCGRPLSGWASASAGTRSSFRGWAYDFHTRGKRSGEQVRFMQALWKEPAITFKGSSTS